MRHLSFILLLSISGLFSLSAQDGKRDFPLGLVTLLHQEQDPQFIYGPVKEIYYRSYHGEEADGEIMKGAPLKQSDIGANLIWQSWSYQFDRNGRVVRLARYDDELKTQWTGIVHYDEDQMDRIYWLIRDTLIGHNAFHYPAEDRIEKTTINVEKGDYIGKTVYSYDKNGHLAAWERFDAEGNKAFVVDYERNRKGHRVSRTLINREGQANWQSVDYIYNDRDLPVQWRNTISRGEKIDTRASREYEYDSYGNWTKMIHRGEGPNQQLRMVERIITYYEE